MYLCADSSGLHVEGRAVRRDPDQMYMIGSEGNFNETYLTILFTHYPVKVTDFEEAISKA